MTLLEKSAAATALELDIEAVADEVLSAALQEYRLTDNLAGQAETAGRHAAVRGMMARLGLYNEFVKALNDGG